MTTLISFASRQIWPQVVAIEYFKPAKIIFLHSSDEKESLNPARRLKKLITHYFLPLKAKGQIELIEIPHDSIEGIKTLLVSLNLNNCMINLTGGNKLMTIAGYEWSKIHSVEAFYIERGNKLIYLSRKEEAIISKDILVRYSAIDLIKCQMDGLKISIPGETLTLDDNGNLQQEGTSATQTGNAGDKLEYATAEAILKLGVPTVHRSVELKGPARPGLSNRLAVMEIDLLFKWDGRIWIVDCKDKNNTLIQWFDRVTFASKQHQEHDKLKKRLSDELAKTDAKAFKDDLIAASIGGILGRIISVRKVMPSEDIANFAKCNGIDIVLKSDLKNSLEAILFPDKPATAASLTELENSFS